MLRLKLDDVMGGVRTRMVIIMIRRVSALL